MADRRAQIEARLAAAEADAERHRRLAEQWKEVADAADDVIGAVLAALYRGPGTGAVIRSKEVMAERDALAAKLAAVQALAEQSDYHWIVVDTPDGQHAQEGSPCVSVDDLRDAIGDAP